jgi:perosamine synthetase
MSNKIAWWTPRMTGAEEGLIREVINANYLNEGEWAERFEQELSRRLNVKHAVACTSGTMALFLSLAALGIGHGDEVIVPDITFIASANAVTMTGAKPVLVDIDPRTLTIDLAATERSLTARTKAIMPVHVTGRAADMAGIMKLARSKGLFVVEDAAEGFTSRVNGKFLGTIGDAGCLSFSPNKTITTGQGGAVLVNDDALHIRLRELKDQGRPVRGTGGDDVHHSVGYNFKFTNLQAAVGLAQLTELDARVKRQCEINRLYRKNLTGVPGITILPFDLDNGEVPQWTDALIPRRDELDRYLGEQGCGCRRFWFPLHTQQPYRLPDDKFQHAARMVPQALWLPSAFTLTDQEIARVCGHIRDFFKAN